MANPAVTYEDFNAEENTAHEEHIEIIRQEAEWFDLTPIEKKLCGASLGLGIALLAVFAIGFPNCSLSCAYLTASLYAASAKPTD